MRRRSLERFEELRGRAGATASADNASAGETPVVKDMFLGPEGIAVDDASIHIAEVGSSRIHTLSKPAGATDTHLAEGSPVRARGRAPHEGLREGTRTDVGSRDDTCRVRSTHGYGAGREAGAFKVGSS